MVPEALAVAANVCLPVSRPEVGKVSLQDFIEHTFAHSIVDLWVVLPHPSCLGQERLRWHYSFILLTPPRLVMAKSAIRMAVHMGKLTARL